LGTMGFQASAAVYPGFGLDTPDSDS
jgi:hypothetical protein